MSDKKNKGLGLPETKGRFQFRGIVTGTAKDGFYKEMETKNKKPFRIVNFGVQVDKDTTMYLTLSNSEQDKVYFSKSSQDENGKRKTDVEAVDWKDRFTFEKEGYQLIGVNCGVKKTLDKSGKEVNDKVTLTPYDACREISENLKDGASVFVRGDIEYSTYKERRQMRFVPTQVSLCRDVDFEADDFKPMADFTQIVVFTDIKQSEDKSRYVVSAKIVGYSAVEDAELYVMDAKLASKLKKGLKPYQSIKVWGNIRVETNTELVTETENDCWGEENEMERINMPVMRELIITGADPKTIEKEVYSEAAIDAAIAKMKAAQQAKADYGDSKWGSVPGNPIDDETGW